MKPIFTKIYFLIGILIFFGNKSLSQDSLSHSQIDELVKKIEAFPCTTLDTGFINNNRYNRFRECYTTDSSGKLISIEASVTNSIHYSTYTRFFFYTKVNCSELNSTQSFKIKKLSHLRLAEIDSKKWKKRNV